WELSELASASMSGGKLCRRPLFRESIRTMGTLGLISFNDLATVQSLFLMRLASSTTAAKCVPREKATAESVVRATVTSIPVALISANVGPKFRDDLATKSNRGKLVLLRGMPHLSVGFPVHWLGGWQKYGKYAAAMFRFRTAAD